MSEICSALVIFSFRLDAGITAVNRKDCAGDVGSFFGSEKDGGGVEFAWFTIAFHRDVGFGEFLEAFGVENGLGEFGVEVAWADSVAGNSLGCEFGGNGAGEVYNSAF